VSPARKRLYFVLGFAAVGMFAGASLAPRGGARWVSSWTGDFLGQSPLTLGAVGAVLGLLAGLALAWRWGSAPPSEAAEAADAPPPRKRRWKAPKRFGKRGR
jgi:hypothetical protein